MATIILNGVITAEGKLELEIPPGLPAGPVEVEIRPQELRGISAKEILAADFVGMWKDRSDLDDSVEYARQLRKRASRRENS
ncbi:MAG: hypothetical protein K8L99_04450 [Anaerolineae bacterium]|nr:hypothetical protein [Anaerolineae bacterium]